MLNHTIIHPKFMELKQKKNSNVIQIIFDQDMYDENIQRNISSYINENALSIEVISAEDLSSFKGPRGNKIENYQKI